MTTTTSALPQTAPGNWRGRLKYAAPVVLIVAGLLAYSGTFDVPLLFDDLDRIEANPAMRTLWPVWVPMSTTNRPLGTYTFAVNYALHGYRVWGYHAVNLAIHLAAGLALFGIVRRTLGQSARTQRFRSAATPLALTIALVWLVHPLQTESVTYIVQRLESLTGLCCLAMLYGFVRAAHCARPGWWYAAAIVVCALGMGTKEVMVTAPLLVLLYDRIFVADNWRAIFFSRRRFYLGLSATWGVLAWSMLHWQGDYSSGLIGSADQLTPLSYLLSQAGVLTHYLRLCVWPIGQCLDTAWPVARTAGETAGPLLLIAGLLLATVWSLYCRPAWGFLGACFFLLLAPTSSVVPIHDLAVEHRMYLASAAVIAAAVLAAYAGSQALLVRLRPRFRNLGVAGMCATGGIALALGVLTYNRNEVYRSPVSIWQDTLARSPRNARACCNLGEARCKSGRPDEALELFFKAVELAPNYSLAEYNLGTTLNQQGRFDEATDHLFKATLLKPDYAEAYNNLGLALCQRRQTPEGVGYLLKAVELKPDDGKFQNALGTALYALGEFPEAIRHLRRAVEITATDASGHYNLANALLSGKQFGDAVAHYRQTLEVEPAFVLAPQVHYGLGVAWDARGEPAAAIAELQQAIALKPDYVAARCKLGHVYNAEGRMAEAIAQYEQVLQLEPGHIAAARALRLAHAGAGPSAASVER